MNVPALADAAISAIIISMASQPRFGGAMAVSSSDLNRTTEPWRGRTWRNAWGWMTKQQNRESQKIDPPELVSAAIPGVTRFVVCLWAAAFRLQSQIVLRSRCVRMSALHARPDLPPFLRLASYQLSTRLACSWLKSFFTLCYLLPVFLRATFFPTPTKHRRKPPSSPPNHGV